jgi:NAD-dependent deacetylase
VLVVGTSLTVYPAAGLVEAARPQAERVLNSLEMDAVPRGFSFLSGNATQIVPALAARWLAEAK